MNEATGLQTMRTALKGKSYILASTYHPREKETTIERFEIWVHSSSVVVLQVFKDGDGFEAYKQLTPLNDLEATIAAIPD